MTQNQRRTEGKCKQFVNFSKHVAFFAKNCSIYMNPHKAKKNKTKEKQNGNGKAL